VDVGRRMIGADLEAYFFLSFGHDRVVEAGSENAIPAQPMCEDHLTIDQAEDLLSGPTSSTTQSPATGEILL
jgi:hypothetical protein